MSQNRLLVALCCAITFLIPQIAIADLPLTVEDIITDEGMFKINVGMTYVNRSEQGISTGAPITVQTGGASFITIPSSISERNGNSDSIVGTLGVHYGLTKQAEIYARMSYLSTSMRAIDATGISSATQKNLSDAWIGTSYQFKGDEKTPALLGFTEIAVREKGLSKNHAFKTSTIGITTYTALDPIVLSLTSGYKWSRKRTDGDVSYQPSSLLFINPSVAFAANDRITLSAGVQWSNQSPAKINQQPQDIRRTNTSLDLGLSYGISTQSTINCNLKSNVSGQNGADLSINWQYRM